MSRTILKNSLKSSLFFVVQGAKKMVFFTSNANVLQSTWSKFMKFLLHIFILVSCKILWLDIKKCSKFFPLCYKNDNFEWNLMKKGLGSSEVDPYQIWTTKWTNGIFKYLRNFRHTNEMMTFRFVQTITSRKKEWLN